MPLCSNAHPGVFVHESFAATRAGPPFIDEYIAHNPVHPAVEAGSFLPLVAAGKSALDGHLAQIVAIGR